MNNMNRHALPSPSSLFRFSVCLLLLLAALPVQAFRRPAAPRPVDTRCYTVDGIYRTLSPEGNVLSETPPPSDGPGRLVAAISPAQIVYSDPETGQALGTSRFIGMAWLFNMEWRQYKAADGSVDLVDSSANIRKVVKRPDGNFATTDMKEIDEDEGVGQTTVSYIRPLWATNKIPRYSFPTIDRPNNSELFRIELPGGQGGASGGQGGASGGQGFTPPSFPTPQTPDGQGGGAQPPRRQLTPAQKQLLLGDMELQISQLEGRLQQLQHDKIRAEGNLQRAIAINVGVVMAQAQVTQIIQQINNTQFQLTTLRQQRMMLMSQP